MSITFGELKTRISTVLQDPSLRTFTDPMVEELVYAGLAQVGRMSPEQFVEDIDLVADQLSYTVRSDTFDAVAIPEIEIARVEVWDPTQSPDRFIKTVNPAATEFSSSDSGWAMWGGTLTLPTRLVQGLQGHENDYVLRVYGYAPYPKPVDDADVVAISFELEQALVDFAHLEALSQLIANRSLFSQWQTRSGNTDTSYAALLNNRNIARDEWRHQKRELTRLRSEV